MWVLALHSWEIEEVFSTSKDSAMVFKRLVAVIKSAKFFRGNSLLSLKILFITLKYHVIYIKPHRLATFFPNAKCPSFENFAFLSPTFLFFPQSEQAAGQRWCEIWNKELYKGGIEQLKY